MAGQPPRVIAGGRFTIGELLGEGAFGKVYKGFDTVTSNDVAIKFEIVNTSSASSLKNEAHWLDMLSRPHPRHGFVECFYFKGGLERTSKETSSVMVMELLGSSLEVCLAKEGGKFDVGTTALIAEQALHRIEYLHSKGILHRDIKPDNFMWGVGRKMHHVYLIDFGMSAKFWERKHVSEYRTDSLTGTARYASINAHCGITQSRRDDLEAIGYMLLYLLRGSLPWSGLKARTQEEKFAKIAERKAEISSRELCDGFPVHFTDYLQYCRLLGYKDRPDYRMMQKGFNEIRVLERAAEDWDLPWIKATDVNVNTLMPHDPGCGHLQPDDVTERTSRNCFQWRRSTCSRPVIMREQEKE